MLIVTNHAVERYVERIAPGLSLEAAREALASHTAACECAANFGCGTVLTPAGARLVLSRHDDGSVAIVTVKQTRLKRRPVPVAMRKRFGKARRAVA